MSQRPAVCAHRRTFRLSRMDPPVLAMVPTVPNQRGGFLSREPSVAGVTPGRYHPERALGHVIGGVRKTYVRRHRYRRSPRAQATCRFWNGPLTPPAGVVIGSKSRKSITPICIPIAPFWILRVIPFEFEDVQIRPWTGHEVAAIVYPIKKAAGGQPLLKSGRC